MKSMTVSGVLLLELLVASALAIFIISGLIIVYLSVKSNNNLQQTLVALQESGRFVDYILGQRIRIAGFVDCKNRLDPIDQNQAIIGYDSQHLPAELQNQVVAATDVVVINSCVDQQSVQMAYYIGDTNRKNSQGQKILALFQKPLNGNRMELVAGIEQMHILYGVTVNQSSGLKYFKAAQISDWQKVLSVSIHLLVNSIEPAVSKPQPYDFAQQTILPEDLLIHKPWSIYITLRERNRELL